MGYLVYVHTNARKKENKNYAYYATVMYADAMGKQIVASEVQKLGNQSDNVHLRAIQCYVNALELIYKNQTKLLEDGVTDVALVLTGETIKKWLKGGAPKQYRKILDDIHTRYNINGSRGIILGVGLASTEVKNKVYMYCDERYVNKGKEGIKNKSVLEMLEG